MKKSNIIQFSPYFPPHKGGLETVAEEIGINWSKNNLGEFFNVITDFEQEEKLIKNKKVIFENEVIGYIKDGYEVLIIPSFEIINNFPVYKIWDKKYFLIKKYLREKIGENNNDFRIFTHTRFFITSLIGGLFARKNNLKWIHIEHGSDYVKLSSKIKSYLSIIYDKIIGKWIFKKADIVLAISEACKCFINKEFLSKEVSVFYRGLDLSITSISKKGDIKIIYIGRLVNLKGVSDLIEAYKSSGLKNELIIIGDGEEKESLEKDSKGFNVKFLGYKDRDFIMNFLSENNCIFVNPSYQEGMPTTVIEALYCSCPVIATNVGGSSEISNNDDLILFEAGNKKELEEKLNYVIKAYNNLFGKSLDLVNTRFSRDENIFKLYNLVK